MSYVVTVNNQVFTSKDEALKYLENTYLVEQSDLSEPDRITSLISDVIPSEVKVNVTYETNEWSKYKIEVGNENFMIDAYLDIDKEESYGGLYTSIDDVVNFYKWSIPTVLNILNKVKERYNFVGFKLERYHNDYGNGHYFDFVYQTIEGNGYRVTYEGGNYEKHIDEFVNQFEQHFINAVQGYHAEIRDDGYFEDYSINGIPIKGLLQRAARLGKQVRLEIVE